MAYHLTVSVLENVRSDVQLIAEIQRHEEDFYPGGERFPPFQPIPVIPIDIGK